MSEMRQATLCRLCGPGVKIDEDGTCALCGATAIGPYADKFRDLEAEVEWLKQWERVALSNKKTAQNQEKLWIEYKAKWEAAEAKLAAIEGVQRYDFRNGDPYERFEAWMPQDDNGAWAKWSDIQAILDKAPEAP